MTTTAPSLDDILHVPTQDELIDERILPAIQSRGSPITDWLVNGIYRTFAFFASALGIDVFTNIAAFAAAGFEDYVFGFLPTPSGIDVTGWAPLVAKQRYGLDPIGATFTRRRITLTNSSSTSYGPLAPGKIILLFPSSGNRYILDETVTIGANATVQAVFRSEFAATSGTSYNGDLAGATIIFVTATFPGVVASNPATTYSAVTQNGTGTGTLTLGGTADPGHSHLVAVRIDVTGSAGDVTVKWSTMLDGGVWTRQSGTSVTNLGGKGINITLGDNGVLPAFATGDVYFFRTPGDDIVQVGRDAETPQQLGTRCRALLPMLGFPQDAATGLWIPTSPTVAAYAALARSANAQVVLCLVSSGLLNNSVILTVAGQGLPLSAAAIANLQSFFDHLNMCGDVVTVQSPSSRAIALGGLTIYCRAAQLKTAQATAKRAVSSYLQGVDPNNPISVNPFIERAYLMALLRSIPGVTKIDDGDLTVNGATADLQLPVALGAYELATWTQDIGQAFTWAPV